MAAHPDIASLIPHAGEMVLIDEIITASDTRIECGAHIADPANHPLTHAGTLPATALAEFGAQAMAVHGGVLAQASGAPPRQGLLAALSRLELALSHIDAPCRLVIAAEQLMHDNNGQIYEFTVSSEGDVLARGQATVMFPDATSSDPEAA